MRSAKAGQGEASSILYVRNLPFKISNTELYDIFGKYGAIRQIRLGNAATTRGTAYVVYNSVQEAVSAHSRLTGFNVAGRYLVCGYFRRPVKKDEVMKEE